MVTEPMKTEMREFIRAATDSVAREIAKVRKQAGAFEADRAAMQKRCADLEVRCAAAETRLAALEAK